MKQIVILIWVVATLLLATILYVFFLAPDNSRKDQPSDKVPILDNPDASKQMISLPAGNGTSLSVKNFLSNGETIPDTVNPGNFVLAGSLGYCLGDGSCPSGASSTSFSISFSKKYSIFNVMLLEEPLSVSRTNAEQFLLDRLGVSEDQLCILDVQVGAPPWVSEMYVGQNLGFSFCPGAVQLPE